MHIRFSLLQSLLIISLVLSTACTSNETTSAKGGSDSSAAPPLCDQNQAMNKMLALSKVQARLVARGGEAGRELSQTLAEESVPVGLLISEEKFEEACRKAAAIEAKYRLNLAREQENMVSAEQLLADGGKGSGSCSIADAAKMQMEVHSQLQAEVDAGRKPQEIFEEFGKDTLGIGEFLSTNPSKACELLTRLKGKYGIE